MPVMGNTRTQNTHRTRLTYSNTVCYTLVLLVVVVSRGFVRMWVRNNSSISGAIRTPGMLKIDASGKKKENLLVISFTLLKLNSR